LSVLVDVTERSIYLLGWPDPDRTMEPSSAVSGGGVGSPTTVASVALSGLPGASQTGSVQVDATVSPDGVASSAALGTAQLNIRVAPTQGIPSTLQFGTTTAFISMNPTGIDAEGGGLGTPSAQQVMSPTGVSSGETFGDTDILATVFVIPGPVDPSNDFGNPIVTQKRLIFRPPTQTLGWGWYKRFEGISLIKKDGAWSEVPWPTNQDTLEADIYLAGGRDHAVSTTLAAELISEGYTISEEY